MLNQIDRDHAARRHKKGPAPRVGEWPIRFSHWANGWQYLAGVWTALHYIFNRSAIKYIILVVWSPGSVVQNLDPSKKLKLKWTELKNSGKFQTISS